MVCNEEAFRKSLQPDIFSIRYSQSNDVSVSLKMELQQTFENQYRQYLNASLECKTFNKDQRKKASRPAVTRPDGEKTSCWPKVGSKANCKAVPPQKWQRLCFCSPPEAGWYKSEVAEHCGDACSRNSLVCRGTDFRNAAEDGPFSGNKDDFEEGLKQLEVVEPNCTIFSSRPSIPFLMSMSHRNEPGWFCRSASGVDRISCDRVDGGEASQSLCYCSIAADGWYKSEEGETCWDACSRYSLVCKQTDFRNAVISGPFNGIETDFEDGLKQLGLTYSDCAGLASQPEAPAPYIVRNPADWRTWSCSSPSGDEQISCDIASGEDGQKNGQSLCYCSKE